MTEIENIEEAIKLLQSKLDLLKEIEKHKSPEEEAYKEWWGGYLSTNPSISGFEDNMWRAFQKGYQSAKADLADKIELFLPKPQSAAGSQSVDAELLVEGWNNCISVIKGKLRCSITERKLR